MNKVVNNNNISSDFSIKNISVSSSSDFSLHYTHVHIYVSYQTCPQVHWNGMSGDEKEHFSQKLNHEQQIVTNKKLDQENLKKMKLNQSKQSIIILID